MLPSPSKQWLMMLGFAVLFCASQVGIAHHGDGRHYALATQLVEKQSIDVGPMWYATGVKDPKGERVVLTERPGAAILSSPFYLAGKIVEKFLPRPSDEQIFFSFKVQITLVASACAIAASALLIFFLCLELGCRPKAAYIAMAAFALSTPAFVYAGRLNEAPFATFVLLLFTYGYMRLRSGWDTPVQQLGLGIALGLALLVHDLTLMLWPVFMILVLMQGKHLGTTKTKPLLIFLPALIGLFTFFAYNNAAFGGAMSGAGGEPLISSLIERYTAGPKMTGLVTLLYSSGSGSATISDVVMPPKGLGLPRYPGLLIAVPQVLLGLLGIMNLRREPITRRPLYVLMIIIGLWFYLATGQKDPLSKFDRDVSILLPVLGLIFVLVGSFIDYHLMAMKGSIIKSLFWLVFAYFCLLGFANVTGVIITRNIHHPEPQLIRKILPMAPTKMPEHMNHKQALPLLAPSLSNLIFLLPIAAIPLGAPIFIRRLKKSRKSSKKKKSGDAGYRGSYKPKKRTTPLTDKGRYEAMLAESGETAVEIPDAAAVSIRTTKAPAGQAPRPKAPPKKVSFKDMKTELIDEDATLNEAPKTKKVYQMWDDADEEG
jgi:hypothetical protein